MSRQDQNAGDGAIAIQSGGDVTIYQGMTSAQMAEIMLALASQLQKFQADAEKKVDERLNKFRDDMLKQFSNSAEANPEAFKDPDFQFLLLNAQNSFARSGDDQLGEILVKLLAERSMQPDRSRVSLVLNRAAETVNLLTSEELSILSLAFVIFYTGPAGQIDYKGLLLRFSRFIVPFMSNAGTSLAPYEYLESLGCLSINHMIGRNLRDIFVQVYGSVLTDGFSQNDFDAVVANAMLAPALRVLLVPHETNLGAFRFAATNKSTLDSQLKSANILPDVMQRILAFFDTQLWNEQIFEQRMRADASGFDTLEGIWANSALQKISLTSLGKALGHANLLRIAPEFQTKIDIWVQ
jgi:hypothetical protein